MGKKKNSFLKKLALIMILVFVVALGIVSCTFFENKTLSVPKSIIQGKVDKKFPITKNFLFAKVTLKNPKVDFKGDKMYIDADYSASLVGSGISGKMYLSTNVRYDTNKEEFIAILDPKFLKVFQQFAITNNVSLVALSDSTEGASASVFDVKQDKKIYTTKERDKSIFINIGRLFWHKLAALVVFNTDLILISKFISLEAVGIYASYLMISQMVASIFNIFINVLRPKVGKFIAKHTKEEVFFLWKKLNILFLFFSLVAIMSIYFLIDDFIKLWLGEKFIFSKLTTILILINFFIYFSRMITDIFKDGDGFFEDTNLPILEAIINFLISLILVNLIGINGVIIGTIVSNILIICIARPILVFKRCFNKGTNEYIKLYRQYLFFIMVTILISCLIINNTPIFIVKTWLDFILKAAVVGGINFVLILIIFLKNSDFRKNYKLLVLE